MFKNNKYYCDCCGKEITNRCDAHLKRVKTHFCNNECKYAYKLNKIEIHGNTTIIYVKNSKQEYQCLVDTEDYLNKIKPLNCTLFAYNNYKSKKPYIYFCIKNKKIKLHRFLTNCPENMVVDHINGIVTDNRQENLRICNNIINSQNRGASKNNKTCGVRGVCWRESRKLWIGLVQINGVRKRVIETKDFNKCCEAVANYRKQALADYNRTHSL